MSDHAPAHLLARLRVLESHARHLARDRGLEGAYADELAALARRAEQAGETRSQTLVDTVIGDLRAFARRVAADQRATRTLTDPRGALKRDRPAGLSAPDEPERP